MNKRHVLLSIIITAHNEGLIAHKTLLSVERALRPIRQSSIPYEILIAIDKGDEDTLNYFKQYENSSIYRIVSVAFGDLSSSRNNAACEAHGKTIAFLDADDLVSKTWLDEAYKIASSEDCIVHPEYSITFGDDNLVWKKRNSGDIAYDTLCFIDNNLWDSPSMARREIYLTHPYEPNGNGFGYEDKQFHAETLAEGIVHKVAPDTILFVRRKITGSMLRDASGDRATIAPTSLLQFDWIAHIDLTPYLVRTENEKHIKGIPPSWQRVKPMIWRAHRLAKRFKFYQDATKPLRTRYAEKKNHYVAKAYPQWLLDEWRAMHKIDNGVFPANDLLATLPRYNAENILPGIIYTKLVQSFKTRPDTLFFVPWLIKGGADMLFINYSAELERQHKDWKVAILQTEQKESVWGTKLPDGMDFVNLFGLFEELDHDTQFRLLATFVTQNDVRRIIVGNSQLAYDFTQRYETLVRRLNIAIYCFAFGEEFDDEGRLWGHIHTGIPRIYPVIHRIITDNRNTVNKLIREYAFDPNKFAVHYQPTSVILRPPMNRPTTSEKTRVLWASRVCKQKRPDILMEVAKRLDPTKYTVDAFGQLEENFTVASFEGTNVRYRGAYNGINTISTEQYDIFLYTSEGDGIPNILQEITASGLPIVASNVGGIGEMIITNQTGILIDDHNNIDDYVTAITLLASDNKLRLKLIKGAQELLASKFARASWVEQIRKDFDR